MVERGGLDSSRLLLVIAELIWLDRTIERLVGMVVLLRELDARRDSFEHGKELERFVLSRLSLLLLSL